MKYENESLLTYFIEEQGYSYKNLNARQIFFINNQKYDKLPALKEFSSPGYARIIKI